MGTAFVGDGFGHIIQLLEQDPHWLPDPQVAGGRRGLGVGFLCPVHGNHRVHLYFRDPLDGDKPDHKRGRLYSVENIYGWDTNPAFVFARLSVLDPVDESIPIKYACGVRFWLAGGALIVSTR